MPQHVRPQRAALGLLVLALGTSLAVTSPVTAAAATAAPAPATAPARATGIEVGRLEVEQKQTPIGIDVDRPRFSWVTTSGARGVEQQSYRLRLATTDDGRAGDLVWDSGVQASDASSGVEYDGPALQPTTGYTWSVDVVTTAGSASATSSFRTGMLDPADWGDSAWIGNARTSAADALGVAGASWIWTPESTAPVAPAEPRAFRRTISDPAGRTAARAEIVITADDSFDLRVNGVQVAATQGEVNQWQQAQLHRVDLQPTGNVIAVRTTNGAGSPAGLIARVRVTWTDGTRTELTTDTAWRATKQVPADWASPTLDDSAWPAAAVQATYGSGPWGSGVRAPQAPVAPAPLLRRELEVDGEVEDATLYVAAGGYADATLNGAPVNDEVLSPGFTDYDDTAQYVGTDVTDQLAEGTNTLGLELGRGFYGMTGGNVWNWQSPPWHDEPVARAVLEIEYADGRTERVVTDDSWTVHDGPTRFDDLYGGELFDASQVQPGWDTTGFDDDAWIPASEVRGPRGELVNQRQQPIRVTEALPAEAVTQPVPGTWVVRFPRVLAGWVEYTAQGPVGTTIRAQAGEKLRADGTVNVDNNGGFQSGFQTDRFVLAGTGAPETWEPSFSYKGFQYLQVTGWPGDQPPPLSAFTAKAVHTDAPRTGSFESSDATMNATHEAVVDTLANNMHGIPTDTPMFEKNGWTGDAAVGAEMFMLNFDVGELFAKWLRDVHETRDAEGAPMVIAPSSGSWGEWGVAPPWHSAYVLIPWWQFQYTGDDRVLREQYDGMKAYVDLELGRSDDGLVRESRLGDWVSPEASPAGSNAPEDTRLSATAYLYTMLTSMQRSALHLGKAADAADFAAGAAVVKDAFNATFLDTARGLYRGSGDRGYRQTHNVLAVAFGLVPDAGTEQRVVDSIAADVRAKGVHLNTGVLGTKYLLPVLTDHGHADLAHELAVQRTYPSWGYMIDQGATSMWEHWSLEARSRGHYFLGTVDDWLFHDVAGINASQETGYRDVTIAPRVTDEMDWARATTDTPWGPVTSDWRHAEDGSLELDVDVPVGSTATVVVPAENATSVVEGGAPASQADGVTGASWADGALSLTVGSGHYELRVDAGLVGLGRVLDRVDATVDAAGAALAVGDLTAAQHDAVVAGLGPVTDEVDAAVTAVLADDDAAAGAAVARALQQARLLRADLAASDVDAPVRAALVGHLDRVVAALEAVVAERLGVSVTVVPLTAGVRPGEQVAGTVTVTSTGTTPVTDLSGTVEVDGWYVDASALRLASLAPGQSVTLPFTATVPLEAGLGERDATVRLTFATTAASDRVTVTETAPWASVTSDLRVTAVTGTQTSPTRGLVTVTVDNPGSEPVDGRVELDTPEGWPAAVPSAPLTVPAGGSVTTEVPVVVPRRVVARATDVTASLVRGGDTLAEGSGTLTVALATPPLPAEGALDTVDLGDAASEQAHQVQASPSSGTSTEAGLTRRYANSTVPGASYSALLDVPAGEPFVLRMRETFDGPTTKVFDLYVDGVLDDRYTLSRSQSGAGWLAHQVVVDTPAALAQTADGEARIRFEFPRDAAGYDPSIADVWVLPVAHDQQPPVAAARVEPVERAGLGRAGWLRGPATVDVVTSHDGSGGATPPVVEVGGPTGWQPWTGPVTVSGDGTHRVDWRVRGAAGAGTGARSTEVRIDATAPVTTTAVSGGAGERATVRLDPTDATSGVARTTYRVDGGPWQRLDGTAGGAVVVTGAGTHVVEAFSTDVAGNDEAPRRTTVLLDAAVPPVVVPPVPGAPTVPGTPVVPPSPGARAASSVRLRAPAVLARGREARLRIRVRAGAVAATGRVVVRVDGRRVRTVAVTRGAVTVRVPLRTRGTHRVRAVFRGTAAVAPSRSATSVVRVR